MITRFANIALAAFCAMLFFACSDEYPEIDFADKAITANNSRYCIFDGDQMCIEGWYAICPTGGVRGDKCPYAEKTPSDLPSYDYCVFIADGLCLTGPFKECPEGGSLSNDCGSEDYAYCVYAEKIMCTEGPFRLCPNKGMPSNKCPYDYLKSSSSSVVASSSSSSSNATVSSSSVASSSSAVSVSSSSSAESSSSVITQADLWDGTIDTTWYTNNTGRATYSISTAAQLAGLAKLVNGSGDNGKYNMENKKITLTSDIALNDTTNWQNWESTDPDNSWEGIGIQDLNHSFKGTFDGNGHTISGIFYMNTNNDYKGLFGYVGGGTITNLSIAASYIAGKQYVGGLAGYLSSSSKVSKCNFTGIVTGTNEVGGLVGYNSGAIDSSYSAGKVSANGDAGGLVGYNSKSISQSYSTSTVQGGGGSNVRVGGLVGYNHGGTIIDCYSIGRITGQSASGNVGGLAGNIYLSSSRVTNCYSAGTLSGEKLDALYWIASGTGTFDSSTSYFDSEKANSTTTYGNSKTTAEMQNADFVAILGDAWKFNALGYPKLKWQE